MDSAIDNSFDARFDHLNERIVRACQDCGRDQRSVHLIGVSKTKPAKDIVTAHGAGLNDFGENYLQDALPKVSAFPKAIWHFAG